MVLLALMLVLAVGLAVVLELEPVAAVLLKPLTWGTTKAAWSHPNA